jgi:hypothetical protein
MEEILCQLRAKKATNMRICELVDEILKILNNTIYHFDIIDYILCGKSVAEFGEIDYKINYVSSLFDALKYSQDEFELILIYYAVKKIHDDEVRAMRGL